MAKSIVSQFFFVLTSHYKYLIIMSSYESAVPLKKKIKKETSSVVDKILSEGPGTLTEMEGVIEKHFSKVKLTEVEAQYMAILKEK